MAKVTTQPPTQALCQLPPHLGDHVKPRSLIIAITEHAFEKVWEALFKEATQVILVER
jgi:hypothetical protein